MSCSLLPVQHQTRLLLYFTVPEFLMSLVHTLWINTKVTSEQPSLKVTKQDIQMHSGQNNSVTTNNSLRLFGTIGNECDSNI
jgi:hypothetical protein